MNSLFKNITTYSPELYQEFQSFHHNKYSFSYQFYTLFIMVLLLFCAIVNFSGNNMVLGLFFLLIFSCFIGWRFLYPSFLVRKESTSKKITTKMKNTFSFYKNYIHIRNKEGAFRFYYYRLYRVFETKNYFYLYYNKNHSFVLSKDGFCLGTSEDFATFIHKKALFKYTKQK